MNKNTPRRCRVEVDSTESRKQGIEGNSMNSGQARKSMVLLISTLFIACFSLCPTAQTSNAHATDATAHPTIDTAALGDSSDAGSVLIGSAFGSAPLPPDKVGPKKNPGKSKAKMSGKSKGKGKKGSKKNSKKSNKPNKKAKPPEKREKDDGEDDPPPGPANDNPMGMAYGAIYKGDEFRSYLDELHVKRYKIALLWQQIEPENDVYDFALIDSYLDQMVDGDDPLVCIFTSSVWGTDGFGKGRPPLDYDDYYDFIYDLVLHCEGKVKYWQRDAEPFSNELHWPMNNWMEYIETQREFYEAVKAADPDAVVVGVGHSGHWVNDLPGSYSFYELLLQYGSDWFDVVDVRLYETLYNISERVEWFRDKMNDYGYTKPIFTTEYGGPHPCQFPAGWDELVTVMQKWGQQKTFIEENDPDAWWKYLHAVRNTIEEPSARMFLFSPSEELEEKHFRILARDIVQRAFLALGAGVERIWYWSLHMPWNTNTGPHPFFGKQRLTDLRVDLKEPSFEVYARMAEKMDGYESIEQVDTGDPEVYLFRVERKEKEPLFVLWEKRDIYDGETLPAVSFTWVFPWTSVVATDVFGNVATHSGSGGSVTLDITDTPLFIEEP